jgi:hypothetical protein
MMPAARPSGDDVAEDLGDRQAVVFLSFGSSLSRKNASSSMIRNWTPGVPAVDRRSPSRFEFDVAARP